MNDHRRSEGLAKGVEAMPNPLQEILDLVEQKQEYINAQLEALKKEIERRMNSIPTP